MMISGGYIEGRQWRAKHCSLNAVDRDADWIELANGELAPLVPGCYLVELISALDVEPVVGRVRIDGLARVHGPARIARPVSGRFRLQAHHILLVGDAILVIVAGWVLRPIFGWSALIVALLTFAAVHFCISLAFRVFILDPRFREVSERNRKLRKLRLDC